MRNQRAHIQKIRSHNVPEPQDRQTFKFFGLEFPLVKGAVWGLSLVAVLGTAGYVYQKLYSDPEKAILSLKEVNQRIAFEVEEYGKHVMEEPTKHELFEDEDGALVVRVYRDHCVLIQRRTRDGMKTRLVPDLARRDLVATNFVTAPQAAWGLPVLYAAQPGCSRGCLNPHPGNFRWWYGQQRKDGWIEVWRQWPEGCTHMQLFFPSRGIWDSNPDGSPRVRWTCCTH